MKKILIGTHNAGKFKEISYLISKKYKKISPISLKIKSPKETGKSFKVIITGGFSDLFKKSIKTKVSQNQDITINGLIKISKLII